MSTKEIAKAAGIAEGTIFRVFDSKAAIVHACIRDAVDSKGIIDEIDRIDRTDALPERLAAAVGIMQTHLRELIGLMVVLQSSGEPMRPPDAKEALRDRKEATAQLDGAFEKLIGDDADQLRIPVTDFLSYLRMLTLSSVHPMLEGTSASPAELVDLVLDGARRRDPGSRGIPTTSTNPTTRPRGKK